VVAADFRHRCHDRVRDGTSRSAGAAAGQLGTGREHTALQAGRRLVISSDFRKAYQSLACIDGVDPLWCRAHIRRYSLRAGAAHPEATGDWCDAWTGRIAALYRARHALAATTPATTPGTGHASTPRAAGPRRAAGRRAL
jgi:Transposase IS66 family